MKILSIDIQNFKPFKRLVLPEQGVFPEGLIIVRGPNSTGKSSLFEAILWALWGHNAVEVDNQDLISFSATSCRVILVFEVDGKVYKISRSYNSADGMAVVLFRETPDGWRPLKDKSKSVERTLSEILNMEWPQARDTLLVRQGEVAQITSATPTDLRNLLMKVYNIELIEQISNQISSLESDIQNKLRRLQQTYVPPEHIASQIEETVERINRYQDLLTERQRELEQKMAERDSLPSLKVLNEIHDAQQAVKIAEGKLKQQEQELDRYLQRAGILDSSPPVIQARLSQLQKQQDRLQQSLSDIDSRLSEIDQEIGGIRSSDKDLKPKISVLETARDAAEGQDLVCPTCSKPLTSSECEHILNEYRQTLAINQQRLNELNAERKNVQQERSIIDRQLRDARDAFNSVERVAEHLQVYEKVKREYEQHVSRLSMKIRELGVEDLGGLLKIYGARDIIELTNRVNGIDREIQSLEREINRIRSDIASEQDSMAKKRIEMEKMREIGAEIDSMNVLLRHAVYVRTKVVSGFVADWVFQKRLIGIIRAATNRYVKEFTLGQYSEIDLQPTPAKGRGGPGLALKLRDERDDAIKQTSQISFGDKTAASLGLRLGISRTMSSIRPTKDSPVISPRMRCVLLDEPLGGLDRERRAAVLKSLMNDRSFKQIFLITHTEEAHAWENVSTIDIFRTGPSSTAILRVATGD